MGLLCIFSLVWKLWPPATFLNQGKSKRRSGKCLGYRPRLQKFRSKLLKKLFCYCSIAKASVVMNHKDFIFSFVLCPFRSRHKISHELTRQLGRQPFSLARSFRITLKHISFYGDKRLILAISNLIYLLFLDQRRLKNIPHITYILVFLLSHHKKLQSIKH